MKACASILLVGLMFCCRLAAQEKTPESQTKAPRAEELLKTLPFEQHTVKDRFGRTITYYLSRWPLGKTSDEAIKAEHSQPLVVFINGSGAQSIFMRYQDKVSVGLQGLLLRIVKGKARVLVVEKPGVNFLDDLERPGSAIGASREFLVEHTLERWTEAHVAAIESAWKLPSIDSTKTLVMGHSEGSSVAAVVAGRLDRVTHVGCLSGGGATQLFSLAQLAMSAQPNDKPGDALRRRQSVYEGWAAVLQDPDSIEKFWMGHPHRRWSSFVRHQSADDLLRCRAKVYLVQGNRDTAEAPSGHEYTVSTLRAAGKEITEELIEGADHGFSKPDSPQGSPDGFVTVFTRVTDWFLAE